jgi:hypothetical protein
MKNILNLVLIQIIAAACSIHAIAVENALHQQEGVISARQWDVVDIRFQVDELPNSADVDFTAAFEHTSGTSFPVAGFYNDCFPEKLMPEDKLQARLIRAFIDAFANSLEDN